LLANLGVVILIESLFDGALIERQRSAARISAPEISFKTALSPNAFGIIRCIAGMFPESSAKLPDRSDFVYHLRQEG
jgi:hypothetical protein